MSNKLPRLRGRIILFLCALLVVLRLGHMAAEESYYGPGPLRASADLVIPPGAIATAAETLARKGAIRHPLLFCIAAYLTRKDGPIHAGEFLIPARASMADIFRILRHGAPVQHQLTIPEGLTAVEITKILNAASPASGHAATPPEGSVLPQTYDYTYGASRESILARAQRAMRRTLAAAWAQRAPGLPLHSPQQALILASIVQAETPLPAELPKIAAVYENRLIKGMKLQADPTVIYAQSGGKTSGGMSITRAALANPSAYNTYMHQGLPPGPIGAPGLAAIQAVLHPAATHALYFVATGDGGHVFADNFRTQLRNIAAYRATRAAEEEP